MPGRLLHYKTTVLLDETDSILKAQFLLDPLTCCYIACDDDGKNYIKALCLSLDGHNQIRLISLDPSRIDTFYLSKAPPALCKVTGSGFTLFRYIEQITTYAHLPFAANHVDQVIVAPTPPFEEHVEIEYTLFYLVKELNTLWCYNLKYGSWTHFMFPGIEMITYDQTEHVLHIVDNHITVRSLRISSFCTLDIIGAFAGRICKTFYSQFTTRSFALDTNNKVYEIITTELNPSILTLERTPLIIDVLPKMNYLVVGFEKKIELYSLLTHECVKSFDLHHKLISLCTDTQNSFCYITDFSDIVHIEVCDDAA